MVAAVLLELARVLLPEPREEVKPSALESRWKVEVKDDPVTEGDLFATIYAALGINPRARHYHGVRPVWLTPEGAKPVKELLG